MYLLTRLRQVASIGLRRLIILRWISGGRPRNGVTFVNCFHVSSLTSSTSSCISVSSRDCENESEIGTSFMTVSCDGSFILISLVIACSAAVAEVVNDIVFSRSERLSCRHCDMVVVVVFEGS